MICLRPYEAADVVFAREHLYGPHAGPLQWFGFSSPRLQAVTDVANVAEQRALEKAGFLREGRLRSAQWRSGTWHDQLLYACVRGDRSPS